jgi:hypothetical protein
MADPVGSPGPKTGGDSGASGAPSGSDAQPKYVTVDEFDERLSAALGKRLGEQGRSLTRQFTELLGKHSEELMGKIGAGLEEKLAALKPKEDPKAKKPEDAPAFKLEELPEWKAHQAELAKLKKLAADAAAERDAERAKTRSSTLRTSAAQELGKVGVPADRTTHALAFLQSQGRITYADGGKGEQVVFLGEDGAEQPLTDGLKTWAKTPDAKIYLPALNPHGSGGSPGAPGNGAASPFHDINDMLIRHVTGQR